MLEDQDWIDTQEMLDNNLLGMCLCKLRVMQARRRLEEWLDGQRCLGYDVPMMTTRTTR